MTDQVSNRVFDEDGWESPSEEVEETALQECFAAALEALGDIDPQADVEDDKFMLVAIIRAFVAAENKERELSKAFSAGRKNVHGFYMDKHHIVASAWMAKICGGTMHPYSAAAQSLLRFARACVCFSALSEAEAALDELSGDWQAEDALQLFGDTEHS